MRFLILVNLFILKAQPNNQIKQSYIYIYILINHYIHQNIFISTIIYLDNFLYIRNM